MKAISPYILIVEDDKDIQDSIKYILEMENYYVRTANNGKEGLALLREEKKPSLVLLDMMMPVMTGRELMDIIFQDEVLSPIPVVVFSASANEEITQGARGFIKKPADIFEILQTVKRMCVAG